MWGGLSICGGLATRHLRRRAKLSLTIATMVTLWDTRYETSPGQLEAVVGEGMPKVLEITYAGKRRSCVALLAFRAELARRRPVDRKSTRLNSSHLGISYAVFCLKKKKTYTQREQHKTTTARLAPTPPG